MLQASSDGALRRLLVPELELQSSQLIQNEQAMVRLNLGDQLLLVIHRGSEI